MKPETQEKFEKFREANGLPTRKDKAGRPYSKKLPVKEQQRLGFRRMEMLDIIALMEAKKYGAVDPDLVADLSQNVKRQAWTRGGRVGTPTTTQELYLLGLKRHVQCVETFQMMGWPAESLNGGTMPHEWRQLTGNMMALQCVGLLLCAVIATVNFSNTVDYTQPARSSQDVD